ncbi:MAG TPA: site-specific integrase [Acidimicrobiales bacterium]
MPRIREKAPGVWEITASTGRRNPATGKYGQVSRTVRTAPRRPGAKGYPNAVEAEAAKLIAEVDGGRHQGKRRTLSELLDEYLRHQEARGRAPKTMLEARRRAERIQADPISAKDVRRLTGRDLDEFYARLSSTGGRSGKGMHSTTRHHFHSLIRAALNQAIRWRWLSPPNPASEARAPALAPDERVPPTPEEARSLALAVSKENPDLAALIFVDATTGMRRGEICGLRFCDVDFESASATIWWRCSDLPKDQTAALEGTGNVVKVFPSGVVMLSATKNKKRRRFALDPITLAVLIEQKARAESRCEALGVELASDAFVWSQVADHSEPWRPNRVSGAFTALRNREKMSHKCLNDLRHFSATQLVAAGIDPRLVAGRLGHDASVLLRIYSHVIPARDQAAAQLLGELMRGEPG